MCGLSRYRSRHEPLCHSQGQHKTLAAANQTSSQQCKILQSLYCVDEVTIAASRSGGKVSSASPVGDTKDATKLVIFHVAEGLLARRLPQRGKLPQDVPLLAHTLAMCQRGDRKILKKGCGQFRWQKFLYRCQYYLQTETCQHINIRQW